MLNITRPLTEFSSTMINCKGVYAPDAAAISLRDEVNSRSQVEIFDYASSAEAFTRAYGMRNALKSYAAIIASNIEPTDYERVCDIGCGSGAFSIAFAHAAANEQLRLQGLDASENQLKLAREAMRLSGLPGNHRFENRSLPDSKQLDADLCISSFWFCENRDIYRNGEALRKLVPKSLLIVDYKEVIDDLALSLPSSYRMTEKASLQVSIPDALLGYIGQSTTTVHFGVLRYLH